MFERFEPQSGVKSDREHEARRSFRLQTPEFGTNALIRTLFLARPPRRTRASNWRCHVVCPGMVLVSVFLILVSPMTLLISSIVQILLGLMIK